MFYTYVEKAKIKFNNRYDYSKAVGRKVTDKCIINVRQKLLPKNKY